VARRDVVKSFYPVVKLFCFDSINDGDPLPEALSNGFPGSRCIADRQYLYRNKKASPFESNKQRLLYICVCVCVYSFAYSHCGSSVSRRFSFSRPATSIYLSCNRNACVRTVATVFAGNR